MKVLVSEDTTAGIEAATSAGMMVIAVPNQWTSQQDFSRAAKVICPPIDLPIRGFSKNEIGE